MTRVEFVAYKETFVRAARMILAAEHSDILSEAALPAYAHSDSLISFLFWQNEQGKGHPLAVSMFAPVSSAR